MSTVSLSLKDTKIKLTERSRGRMKIQIKFSKEEAEGFKNFCKLKPPELGDEDFYKQVFFAGCNTMTEQIRTLVEQHQQSKAEGSPEAVTEEPQVEVADEQSKE